MYGELGALLVECGKRWCLGIETEILEQFMADGGEEIVEVYFISAVHFVPFRSSLIGLKMLAEELQSVWSLLYQISGYNSRSMLVS